MGNRESSGPAAPSEEPASHEAHYRELYGELTAPDHAGQPADQKIFRNRFENYFGGPYLELGHLLYSKFFGQEHELVDEATFVSALCNLESLTWQRGEFHEAEIFYFTVFSQGEDYIDRDVLTKILHVAATFGMVVGSELHEKAVLPKDHYIISSIINSAMLHADKGSGRLHKSNFSHWVSRHCPRLLEGIRQWTKSLLLPQTELMSNKLPYQLPSPQLDGEHLLEREVELCTMIWTLSTALPVVYMGQSNKKTEKAAGYPLGGTWTLLYSSDRHGFSMNRFQHHCSDYKEPSVLVLTCRHIQEKEVYMFAIGCDTEWRDGTYYYGGEHFCLVQLQPSFALIKSGPKLLSLNEKQRGFPTGLRVMTSNSYDDILLEVDSSLESAKLRGGDAMSVRRVEVWGCGGVEAVESQRRVKDWERREILRRRKVKASDALETWENSPDRYLLELGGVATKRPTEQQQQ